MYGAFTQTDQTNVIAEQGKMFNFETSSDNVYIIAPLKILFKTGAKKVKYRTDVSTLGSTVKIELYSAPTTSANGVEIVPVNYNPTVSAPGPAMKMYLGPSVSNKGTLTYTRYFLGWSQGATSVGISKSGAIWRWLPANSTFLAILTPAAD
ncbi:MAG TPA: hypothetical protein PLU93_11695, partial [Treponemataceae bacterium]|nr:hypothetical protein [Treponemataceae bacterium]